MDALSLWGAGRGLATARAGSVGRLALAFALTLTLAAPARADHDSIVTVGVGAGVGVLRSAQPGALSETTFVNQANVRLKMLGVLGVDYSFDLGHDGATAPAEEVQYAAKMRLTALAYIIPTSKVSLYLGGGVGGGSVGELTSVTGAGNSYHVGGGLEVYLSGHIGIDTSFYLIIPGVRSVERHVEHLALTAAEQARDSGAPGPTDPGEVTLEQPGLGDFISPKNYELMIRFFVFL